MTHRETAYRGFWRRWLSAGGLFFLLALARGDQSAPSPPSAASREARPERVEVRTRHGMQMDVWIDGERRGVTPLRMALRPGNYYLTSGAEGLEPVLRRFAVKPGGRSINVVTDVPMTTARFPAIFKELVLACREYPQNAHLLILACLLTNSQEDFDGLAVRIPKPLAGDPTLLMARARMALSADRLEETDALLGQAVAADRRLAGPWRMRSYALQRWGRPEEALAAANEAVLIEPLNGENFAVRGEAQLALGDRHAARLDFERALELRPGHSRATEGLKAATAAP
ncbi:PEGA domain-containing protein [Candidatus Poribacteria bacterium]|nr:PEGA domain-containing protein [Candidatus Poribacteria bacterium]